MPNSRPMPARLVAAERCDEVHRVLVDAVGAGADAAGDVEARRRRLRSTPTRPGRSRCRWRSAPRRRRRRRGSPRRPGRRSPRGRCACRSSRRRTRSAARTSRGRCPRGSPPPPTTTCAPSSWPSAMYFSTRSCWRCATSGPISVAASTGSPTCSEPTISGERLDDFVVALAAREDAGLRDARLTVVHERRELEPVHRGFEVGVVEDDRGRLAAELEAHALQLLAADRRRCAGRPRSNR